MNREKGREKKIEKERTLYIYIYIYEILSSFYPI
jgi:hypothetical protein